MLPKGVSDMQTTTIRLENGEEREMFEVELVARKDGVVKRKRESVILDPKLMTVGEPQAFKLLDNYMVGVKAEDGHVDLYYLPNPDEEAELE